MGGWRRVWTNYGHACAGGVGVVRCRAVACAAHRSGRRAARRARRSQRARSSGPSGCAGCTLPTARASPPEGRGRVAEHPKRTAERTCNVTEHPKRAAERT
eukprot:5234307-Prymnesium_polylepis.1